MNRPTTLAQYLQLVDQALMEVDELRFSADYDSDEMGGAFSFVDALDAQLRRLRESMANGTYAFADADLPFMAIVKQQDELLLPFKGLLRTINDTHRHGLAAARG